MTDERIVHIIFSTTVTDTSSQRTKDPYEDTNPEIQELLTQIGHKQETKIKITNEQKKNITCMNCGRKSYNERTLACPPMSMIALSKYQYWIFQTGTCFLVLNPLLSVNLTLQLTKLSKDIGKGLAYVSRFIIRAIQIEDKFVKEFSVTFLLFNTVVLLKFCKIWHLQKLVSQYYVRTSLSYVDKHSNALSHHQTLLGHFPSKHDKIKKGSLYLAWTLLMLKYTLNFQSLRLIAVKENDNNCSICSLSGKFQLPEGHLVAQKNQYLFKASQGKL